MFRTLEEYAHKFMCSTGSKDLLTDPGCAAMMGCVARKDESANGLTKGHGRNPV